jgi:hypothetical protein
MKVSCRMFARHISSGSPLPGGSSDRFFFWIHWAVCPFCRRYWAEIKAIGELQRAHSQLANHPVVKLPEIKNRLKENLRRKIA